MMSQMEHGRKLRAMEAATIEDSLLGDPSNEEARLLLIGYYSASREQEQWLRHVLWMLHNAPGHPSLWWPEANCIQFKSSSVHQLIESAWRELLKKSDLSANELRNAASLFAHVDPKLSLELIRKARDLEASRHDLQTDYITYSNFSVNFSTLSAAEAFQLFGSNKALLNGHRRSLILLHTLLLLAYKLEDFNSSKEYALKILSDVRPTDHLAHTILGMVSLAAGDRRTARIQFRLPPF
jgi:hypothetical protein